MDPELEEKIKELQGNMDELPMHVYIFLWAVSDMSERMSKDPKNPNFKEITYPFSPVPLFDEKEAKSLEDLWFKNIAGKDIFSDEVKTQKGGTRKLPSVADLKSKATQFGKSLKVTVDALDPKLISPDYLYGYSTNLFDSMDSALTQASGDFGIVALESTMPDPPMGAIPTVPPIPLTAPARSVFPIINAILEVLRIMAGVGQLIDPLSIFDPLGLGKTSRIILTLVMVLLDLARGNLYHAIFTSFGFIGATPMFIGIGLKIMRDAIMLVSPDLRKELRDLLFKSSKSFVVGFHIWLFTTMSPAFVKAPISALFNSVALQIETLNAQIDAAEMQANMGPLSTIATIKLPKIPSDKIPDINNLYALREAVREPAIYCDPKISQLMMELRGVPPYALFFDMANIPQMASPDYVKSCSAFKGASLSDNLAKLAAPQIIPIGSDEPLPAMPLANPVSIADAQPSIAPVSSLTSAASNSPLAAVDDQQSKEPDALAKSPLGSVLGPNPLAALADPQAALKSAAQGAASDALSKSPLGSVLGPNPLATLADPQAALKSAAQGAASDVLAKSPLGAALGPNPLATLADPQAALKSAAQGAASDALSKSPLGAALGPNPLATLSDPHAALASAATKAITAKTGTSV